LAVFLLSVAAFAQSPAKKPAKNTAQSKPAQPDAETTQEERTDRAMEVLGERPLMLYHFLQRMPKGADLHNHLSGAVYAESWIRAGAEDNLCVNTTLAFAKAEGMTKSIPPQPVCGEGKVPAAQAFKDQHLYDALVDSFSMRSFVPSAGVSGHDHFFDSFAKFGGTDKRHTGEWLDEVATRAAAQNEQYLELMETPDFGHAASIAHDLGWQDDFAKFRDALLAHGLREDVAPALIHLDQAEALRRQREHCGQPDETPACKVEIRFLYQVLRGFPKEQVFAQALLGFETACADPRFVGINFVMPEDGYVSMSDYSLHMKIVGYLHSVYPKVHISLHAGEIAPSLVPYEGLCCHIRLAVEEGHAERIGHGVDLMYEDRPYELLKEMAKKHVMVEINLTSNDLILGVNGEDHPLAMYRYFGVPVALSTDDEGVSRINLTHEYFLAVRDYGFGYSDLKMTARASLEHSFLPGASLWLKPDVFTDATTTCAKDTLGGEKPSAGCAAFLNASEKAQQQWELERRLRAFEAKEHLHIGDEAGGRTN
jgi:adenosine deaminase